MSGLLLRLLFLLVFIVASFGTLVQAYPITVQYNQSGQPSTVKGGQPSGDYSYLNLRGEGLTYDIPEELYGSYELDIWHNSSQISKGIVTSINATINFTTNVSDTYTLQIYNWTGSVWSMCQSASVPAGTAASWWCNKTTRPSDFNSSDRVVRIRLNTTGDGDASLLSEDYVQFYAGYQSYLEVLMTSPSTSAVNNIVQNQTFNVNTTARCMNGYCGDIYGTVLYNLSSSIPDTTINTTQGNYPLFISEYQANSTKSCSSMQSGDLCNMSWVVNATGERNSYWKIGTIFNSSLEGITANATENATVTFTGCTLDFNLTWSSISFGTLNPNTGPNNASGNENSTYNITVNPGSCNLDFYINATDLTNSTYNSSIGVGNISWSITNNSYSQSTNLSYTPTMLKANVPQNTNVTTWYWMVVPPIYAGYYLGSIFIYGVLNGQAI